MSKSQHQITFEFSGEQGKEFLSGRVIPVEQPKPKSTRGRKSVKESDADSELIEIPPDEILFKKQYFSIGEVAQMFKVNGSLLRYWESEFNMDLRKNKKGDRFFKPTDIKILELIHDLFLVLGQKGFLLLTGLQQKIKSSS